MPNTVTAASYATMPFTQTLSRRTFVVAVSLIILGLGGLLLVPLFLNRIFPPQPAKEVVEYYHIDTHPRIFMYSSDDYPGFRLNYNQEWSFDGRWSSNPSELSKVTLYSDDTNLSFQLARGIGGGGLANCYINNQKDVNIQPVSDKWVVFRVNSSDNTVYLPRDRFIFFAENGFNQTLQRITQERTARGDITPNPKSDVCQKEDGLPVIYIGSKVAKDKGKVALQVYTERYEELSPYSRQRLLKILDQVEF